MEEKEKTSVLDKIKAKTTKAVKKTKAVCGAVVTVCKENKEVAAAIIMAVVSVGTCATEGALKKADRDARRKDKLCDHYDPVLREHVYTREPLTREQAEELEDELAKKDGRSKREILESIPGVEVI